MSGGIGTTCALFLVRDRVMGPQSPFTPLERLVALCIGDHMNLDYVAWPSLQTIAAETGLGLTSVRAAIARLSDGEDRVFDRERGGARPESRYEATRYRLHEPVAPRGAQEARASAGDGEGIARRALGYRHATQKDPVKGPVKGEQPPLPPSRGATRRDQKPEDAAFKRVYGAYLEAGGEPSEGLARKLRRQLRAQVPEATLLELLEGQARARVSAASAASKSRSMVDTAWDWIEAHGGRAIVARSAVDWAIRHQQPGESIDLAIGRWATEGVPPGVRVILREDFRDAHKRATSTPEEA